MSPATGVTLVVGSPTLILPCTCTLELLSIYTLRWLSVASCPYNASLKWLAQFSFNSHIFRVVLSSKEKGKRGNTGYCATMPYLFPSCITSIRIEPTLNRVFAAPVETLIFPVLPLARGRINLVLPSISNGPFSITTSFG